MAADAGLPDAFRLRPAIDPAFCLGTDGYGQEAQLRSFDCQNQNPWHSSYTTFRATLVEQPWWVVAAAQSVLTSANRHVSAVGTLLQPHLVLKAFVTPCPTPVHTTASNCVLRAGSSSRFLRERTFVWGLTEVRAPCTCG